MKVYLKAQVLWEDINSDELTDEHKDQLALAIIYQAISEETLLVLADKETSLDELKNNALWSWEGNGGQCTKFEVRIRGFTHDRQKSPLMILLASWLKLSTKSGPLDIKWKRLWLSRNFFKPCIQSFSKLPPTIEQFGNFSTMTMEEVIGRLKTHEKRWRHRFITDGGGESFLFHSCGVESEKQESWKCWAKNSRWRNSRKR